MNIIRFFLPNAYQYQSLKIFIFFCQNEIGGNFLFFGIHLLSLTASLTPRVSRVEPTTAVTEASRICSAHVCVRFQVLEQTSGVILITVGLARALARKICSTGTNSNQFTAREQRIWRNRQYQTSLVLTLLASTPAFYMKSKSELRPNQSNHCPVLSQYLQYLL